MSSSYEANYRKITTLDELPLGEPRVFRAAGATLLMRRSDDGVTAIDGSCLVEASDISEELRVRRILDCVAAGRLGSAEEWDQLHARAGLPVRLEEGDIWVCVEACQPGR